MRKNKLIEFPGKAKDEKIFLFLRRHPFSFLPFLALILAMILIPLILVVSFSFSGFNLDSVVSFLSNFSFFADVPSTELSERAFEIVVVLSSAYFLFTLGVFLTAFIDYYLDVVIITNRRIVDINQDRLFARSISECDIVDVEDAKAKIHGMLGTLFHFGDVLVQTAGTQENFELDHIPNPYRIARRIVDLHEQGVAEQEKEQAHEIGRTIVKRSGKQRTEKFAKSEIPETRRMSRLARQGKVKRKRLEDSARLAMEEIKKNVVNFEKRAESKPLFSSQPERRELKEEKKESSQKIERISKEKDRFIEEEKMPQSEGVNPLGKDTLGKKKSGDKGEISKDDLQKGGEVDL